jgi:hypothetical protein
MHWEEPVLGFLAELSVLHCRPGQVIVGAVVILQGIGVRSTLLPVAKGMQINYALQPVGEEEDKGEAVSFLLQWSVDQREEKICAVDIRTKGHRSLESQGPLGR